MFALVEAHFCPLDAVNSGSAENGGDTQRIIYSLYTVTGSR